jgi:S1-C subfamily serine protease
MGAILNAKAGITPGEIITAVGDTPVHSTSDLVSALAKLDPGTRPRSR